MDGFIPIRSIVDVATLKKFVVSTETVGQVDLWG